MTSTEFSELIQKEKFFPIRVEGEAVDEDFKGDIFIGSLTEFFNASRALNAKTIFIASSILSDEDFMYSSESDGDDLDFDGENEEEAEESTEIDLTMVLPSLSEFKKFLTKEYAFLLTAKGGDNELSYYHEEDWWDDFDISRGEAIEKVDKNRAACIEKMERLQEEKDKERVKLVRALIKDPDFIHIPTQRGMKAYALEKHPELEEMFEGALTAEIQSLSDKIIAKGLNRKR